MVKKHFKRLIIVLLILFVFPNILLFGYYLIGSFFTETYNPYNIKVRDRINKLVINGNEYVPYYGCLDFIENKELIYEKRSTGYFISIYSDTINEDFYYVEERHSEYMYIKKNLMINSFEIDYFELIFSNDEKKQYVINNGKRIDYKSDIVNEILFDELIKSDRYDTYKQGYNYNDFCMLNIYFTNNIVMHLNVFKSDEFYYCYSIPHSFDTDYYYKIEIKEISCLLFE